MVKLLELVKSYDELRAQAPPVEAEARSQRTDAAESITEAPQEDPFTTAARDLGMVVHPRTRPPQPPPAPPGRTSGPPTSTPASSVAPDFSGMPALPQQPTRERPETSAEEHVVPHEARSAAAEQLYHRIIRQVSRLFEAAAMETISPGRLRDETAGAEAIAAEIAQAPRAGEELLMMALGTYPEGEGFVVPHSANVAILAAYVGLELGLDPSSLTQTCLAGLTHDLGNVKLADGILYKEGPLSPQEWDELRKRPGYSREILDALGDRYRAAAEIAHQVYERMDGSGYPKGIEGEQILPEARILGAVDFFETVVHPRPYKDTPAGGVSYGLQTLMRMAGQFGQDTLKALVRSVGLFPVGTYVRLSTGEIGRVLSSNRRNPMRPLVQVILDKQKRRTPMPRSIDLVQSPHLYVSKPLSSSDLVELGLLNASEPEEGVDSAAPGGHCGPAETDLPSDSRDEPGSSETE